MNKLTSNFIRAGLLSSLCCTLLLGSCTSTNEYGFEPTGVYYVTEVEISEENNKNNGDSYYDTYKKEHLYDFSTFIFSEDNTVTVTKSYDDTQVIHGTYEYTYGQVVYFLSAFTLNNIQPKLTVTLENGDVFVGASKAFFNNRYVTLSGNGICGELYSSEEGPKPYFAEFERSTPQEMRDLLLTTTENQNMLSRMNKYQDNRYPQAFRELYQSFADRERLFIYPEIAGDIKVLDVVLSAKGELFGLPSFSYEIRHRQSVDTYYYYCVRITYVTENLDGFDADWQEKYKDGGQVWNETRKKVSFVYEYQDPHFAYSETLFVEIIRTFGNEPITEEFVSGLKFGTLANEWSIFDLSSDEIATAEAQYNALKETDNMYNGEKVSGKEMLDDLVYRKNQGIDLKTYYLFEDESVIAVEDNSGCGRLYYQGEFYGFKTERELFILYFYSLTD